MAEVIETDEQIAAEHAALDAFLFDEIEPRAPEVSKTAHAFRYGLGPCDLFRAPTPATAH